MYKILTVIGARPQFVKAAVLSKAFAEQNIVNEVIVHTGQHFDQYMSDVFFQEMGIPFPDYQLKIAGLSHGAMTGRMMEEIEQVIFIEKPDTILVYGDTNSTLAGALAGSKLNIPVIHVEAGLRSFNMEMPEEINRILTDRISSLLFCPTPKAVQNLQNEGFDGFGISIEKVGDIMEDAALYFKEKAREDKRILEKNGVNNKEYVLLTCHRAENTDIHNRLTAIIEGINRIAIDTKVVWPIHPRLKGKLGEYTIHPNVIRIEPVGYLDMINLIEGANLVFTDSGGLQKEAYFFNKYCITLRKETEWVELVENGYNVLVGSDSNKIFKEYTKLKNKEFQKTNDLYGGGNTAQRITKIIEAFFRKRGIGGNDLIQT